MLKVEPEGMISPPLGARRVVVGGAFTVKVTGMFTWQFVEPVAVMVIVPLYVPAVSLRDIY